MLDQVAATLSALAGGVGGALSPLLVPVLGLIALVVAAWVGTRAAATITADAQKQIAKTNAESAQLIARINTESAQTIEQIKADGQRKLEREKFNREWRRERVQPLQKQLEDLRQESVGAITAVIYIEDGTAQSAAFPRPRDETIYLDLAGVCPLDLEPLLQAWIGADSKWQPALREWFMQPRESRGPMKEAGWYRLWHEAENWRLQLMSALKTT
jgi:hypothetical protein